MFSLGLLSGGIDHLLFFNTTGRIRNTPESADELDDDSCVLSLGLFPGEILEVPGDDRLYYNIILILDRVFTHLVKK